MNRKTLLAISLITFGFAGTAAAAEWEWKADWQQLDADNSGELVLQEFESGYFDVVDADDDDWVTEDEYDTYLTDNDLDLYAYDTYDFNDDGYLSEGEFDNGLFDLADTDDDDILEEDEWDSGFWDV